VLRIAAAVCKGRQVDQLGRAVVEQWAAGDIGARIPGSYGSETGGRGRQMLGIVTCYSGCYWAYVLCAYSPGATHRGRRGGTR
jgi:hypothetical protein